MKIRFVLNKEITIDLDDPAQADLKATILEKIGEDNDGDDLEAAREDKGVIHDTVTTLLEEDLDFVVDLDISEMDIQVFVTDGDEKPGVGPAEGT